MKYTRQFLKYLGISFETDDADLYGLSTWSLDDPYFNSRRPLDSASAKQSLVESVYLDDGYECLKTPQCLLTQRASRQPETHCLTATVEERPPLPIEAEVRVISSTPTTKSKTSTESTGSSWAMEEKYAPLDLIAEYLELIGLSEQVPTPPLSSKPRKKGKLKKLICHLLSCVRKDTTKQSSVSRSAILDDVTTLHILCGDTEAESIYTDSGRRLRQRLSSL